MQTAVQTTLGHEIINRGIGKQCPKCGIVKAWEAFRESASYKDGHAACCKECEGGIKYCPGCKRDHPLSAFAKDGSRPDGLQFYCREYISKYNKQRPRASSKRPRRRISRDWTQEDDERLLTLRAAGKAWQFIANKLNRGLDACSHRWRKLSKVDASKPEPIAPPKPIEAPAASTTEMPGPQFEDVTIQIERHTLADLRGVANRLAEHIPHFNVVSLVEWIVEESLRYEAATGEDLIEVRILRDEAANLNYLADKIVEETFADSAPKAMA